ncbi:hypothetical protein OROHE_016852 [Orobanche hederae]
MIGHLNFTLHIAFEIVRDSGEVEYADALLRIEEHILRQAQHRLNMELGSGEVWNSLDRLLRQHKKETFINKWRLVTVLIPSYATEQLVTVKRWVLKFADRQRHAVSRCFWTSLREMTTTGTRGFRAWLFD